LKSARRRLSEWLTAIATDGKKSRQTPMSFSRHAGFTYEGGRWTAQAQEMANVAAFMTSDAASAMTATVANLSMGSLDDQRLSEIPIAGELTSGPPIWRSERRTV
jgi:hypothetical protein